MLNIDRQWAASSAQLAYIAYKGYEAYQNPSERLLRIIEGVAGVCLLEYVMYLQEEVLSLEDKVSSLSQ